MNNPFPLRSQVMCAFEREAQAAGQEPTFRTWDPLDNELVTIDLSAVDLDEAWSKFRVSYESEQF